MSQTPEAKHFEPVTTPGGSKSVKNLWTEASRPQSTKYGRSVTGKSFTQRVYVPKTPKGSQTPRESHSLSESMLSDEQEDFASPAVFKATNLVALRKPSNSKLKRMWVPKGNKSVDLSKEEAKTNQEGPNEELDEIRERSTLPPLSALREELDIGRKDTASPERHSLPAYITCPTEIGGRETVGSQGAYEFKEEAVDENDVVNLENKEGGDNAAKSEGEAQEEKDVICSPLNSPTRESNQQDKIKEAEDAEDGQDNKETENNAYEETVEQEPESDKNPDLFVEEHLITISEEREAHEEDEFHHDKITGDQKESTEIKPKEEAPIENSGVSQETDTVLQDKKANITSKVHDDIPDSEERHLRDRGISENTSKGGAMSPTNDTVSQRNEDAQESFKERTGPIDFEVQSNVKGQEEIAKKNKQEENEGVFQTRDNSAQEVFREREGQEIEVRRNVEEAPKKKANAFYRHEEPAVSTAKVDSHAHVGKDDTENKNKGQLETDSKTETKTEPSNIDIEKEKQYVKEQKELAKNLAQKLEKVHSEMSVMEEDKVAKPREGCCSAGCNMF